MSKLKNGKPVLCDCGKLIAMKKDGKIYIMCKACKRQIPLDELLPKEPRALSQEP